MQQACMYLASLVELLYEFVLVQEALCRQRSHAARSCCCNSLPPFCVKQVPGSKDALHASLDAIMHLHTST